MPSKYVPFSTNQLKLLTWWSSNSPYKSHLGVIATGSVRAGKTLVMALSYVLWAMQNGSNLQYGMSGKTITSLERNVINDLMERLKLRGYQVRRRKEQFMVSDGTNTNTFFLFGGKDERSQDLIQGITLAGMLFDEVALMPRSFVNQAMARCSVSGSKFWFNCNPEGPGHWFYQDFILKADQLHYLVLQFSLNDNPSLDEDTKNRYKTSFTGVFYRRFILGEWVASSGVIYDCFNQSNNIIESEDELPWQVREGDVTPYYSCDYGIFNPHVYLEGYYFNGILYIMNEYYYDGRKSLKQKSDTEYVADFKAFKKERYKSMCIDPSASSFIVAMTAAGERVTKAKNDVSEGINMVYQMLSSGRIKIHSRCINLIQEMGMYTWDEKKAENNGKEQPVKQFDHACDALRYMVMTFIIKSDVYNKDYIKVQT